MSNESELHPLTPEKGFTTAQELVDDLGSFLQQSNIEGSKNAPYVDSSGHPSIGIGINLRDFASIYFDVLGIKNHDGGPGDAERASMSDVIKAHYANNDSATLIANLTSAMASYSVTSPNLSNSQVVTLFKYVLLGENNSDPNNPLADSILANYEKFLSDNDIQTGTTVTASNFSGSLEGFAILSLYYNNPSALLPSTGHLVPDLNQSNFNRADAWFQIRYGSNGGYKALTTTDPDGGGFNGVADRRYLESTFFGLYGNGGTTPSLDYATQVYAELSENTNGTNASSPTGELTNREFAIDYENRYSGEIDVGNDTVLSGQHSLQPFETEASVTQLTGLRVESLEDELQPAFNTLWQHYLGNATLNPFAGTYASTNSIDPLDLQVALAQGGSDLVASQRDGYWLDQGNYLPSVLIAQDGDDTLDGSGTANDALIGGSADDAFFVGSGNDYIVAGTGDDVIGSLASNGMIGPMGGGSDTIVLGDPEHAKGGRDTVYAGSGPETYYLAAGDSDVVYLNKAATDQPVFNIVGAGATPKTLNINATALDPSDAGTYIDRSDNALVLMSENSDGTESVKVIGLGAGGASPLTTQAQSLSPQALAAQSPASLSGGVLELDNFQGTSDAGVTLNAGNATTPGAGNLSDFGKTTNSDGSTDYTDGDYYSDYGLVDPNHRDSMIGVNTTGSNYNVLEGEGNASYIYAGDGNNDAFAGDLRDAPAWSQGALINPVSTVIQGGTGNQLLVGMSIGDGVGDGKETIIGGDMGQDTTAWTTIDGGGINVDALLAGGTQNSLILGGAGADTIVAGSAVPSSGQPAPTTIALAGLTFWAYYQQSAVGGVHEVVTKEPEVSIPATAEPADFQIDVALDQLDVAGSVDPSGKLGTHYGTPFGLLGSEWNTGTATSMWYDNGAPMSLPGSLIIGGSGEDYLIGNSGNDTIIGGTPANPKAGVGDEVLVGSGGANVIYGGDGTELIFADMSAGGDADWADLNPSDADTIYGGTGNEYIYGSGGNDLIYGSSGNYTIYTGNGNAYVTVGSGNSIVNGGTGNDTIIAGSGADSITTGNGDDSIYSGDGQSTINAGSGSDTFAAGTGVATYNAGTGAETYQIDAGAGDQFILGGSSAASIDVTYADGITSGDVTARNDGASNLILTNDSTGARVVIEGYFNGESNVAVNFSDGVTLGAGGFAHRVLHRRRMQRGMARSCRERTTRLVGIG